MPSPAWIMRATTSKLFTWTRSRSGLPASAACSSRIWEMHGVALEADEVVVEELREGDALRRAAGGCAAAPRQSVSVRYSKQLAGRSAVGALHHDADVGRARRAPRRTIAPLRSSSSETLIAGMLGGEGREVVGQVLGERRGVGLDAHHALAALRVVRDLGAQLVDLAEELARVHEHRVARGRELHALRGAVEQLHAELVLELRRCAGSPRRARCGSPAPPW